MDGSCKTICKLCMEKTPLCECETIDEKKREMLEVLRINITFDISDYAVACNSCLERLQNCFDFKSRCITPSVEVNNDAPREMTSNYENIDTCQVCQLCRSLIENKDFNYITDLSSGIPLEHMIRKCLPEIDLNTVSEPAICKACVRSIDKFYSFMQTCQILKHQSMSDCTTTAICGEMLKRDDPGKLTIIKTECLDTENEYVASIKYEEVHIKDELENKMETCETVTPDDNNSSRKNNPSKRKSHIKKSAPKGNKVHSCVLCPFVTSDRLSFEAHMATHKGLTKAFGCWECPYETDLRGNLLMHVLKHKDKSEVEIHKCVVCLFESKYKAAMLRHQRLKHNIHICRQSADETITNNESNLDKHISSIHKGEEPRIYECRQCTIETRYERRLLAKLNHEKGLPYPCPSCDKVYDEKVIFDNHLLTNHDDFLHLITSRVHSCKLCPFKSTFLSHLTNHIVRRHDRNHAKKFQCEHCDYFALVKSDLSQHLLVHANFRPHQCTSCEKGFNQKQKLYSHILNYHKEEADLLKTITSKIYRCALCEYQSIIKTDFYRHIKRNHK